MKARIFDPLLRLSLILILVSLCIEATSAAALSATVDHSKGIQFTRPPLRFEINEGQSDPQVRFTVREGTPR